MANLLILDNDLTSCQSVSNFFTRKGHNSCYFTSGKKALEYLQGNQAHVVFSDFSISDIDGKELLFKIKEISPGTEVVFFTSHSNIKIAVEVIKLGAYDYISKPLLPEETLQLIERATGEAATVTDKRAVENNTANRLQVPTGTRTYVMGKSSKALDLQNQISLVAPTNYSVIIHGDSGTGKESVAYMIHQSSQRKNKPFVAIDCGTLTKELAGSELFGHEKGSFTGALQSKIGQFELANGGTIFLDEITNLPYDVQVCLLRVIQERKIRRIGSTKEISIDVRILVASNERINEAISHGKFREDLFYRFNEFSIDVPPLHDRKDDILVFADFFLQKVNAECNKTIRGFAPDVEKVFLDYNWPGNLREMDNVIKRSALLSHGNIITLETLPREMVFKAKLSNTSNSVQNGIALPELKSVAITAECEKILEVLRRVNFNKSEAAMILNIDRKTLYNKIKTFNLSNGQLGSFMHRAG